MQFDDILPMRDVFNGKHVRIASHIGIDVPDAIPMQVADSDYASPPCVVEALRKVVDVGAFCYGYDKTGYLEALRWWMDTRHGWAIDPDWVVTSQGLGHAIATCIDIWTEPGDGVCYFAPVYHEFRLKTERAGRTPVELPLALVDGRYELDWDAAEAAITPNTRLLLFCSPQNPSGRVWTAEELRAVADFAARHRLVLVSDEVHCDLIYDGFPHVPMDVAAPEHRNRTVTLFAGSKTFNLAGLRIGQMILPDPDLRARVESRMTAWNYDPATLGIVASKAAYSSGGAEWLKAQMAHLARNRQLFDEGINAIPGVTSMRLQSTFLPWVDFSGTGMDAAEITRRVHREARIGTAPGSWFGAGGETFQRFNIAMPRSVVEDAVERMQKAFSDLQ